MSFQHPYISRHINMTVLSGILNGTGTLRLTDYEGIFTITITDNVTILITANSNDTSLRIDGSLWGIYTSSPVTVMLIGGQSHVLNWQWISLQVPIPWDLSLLFIGLFGIFLMVFSLAYGMYRIKHGEIVEGLGWALILFVISIGLIVAWLWR